MFFLMNCLYLLTYLIEKKDCEISPAIIPGFYKLLNKEVPGKE